MKANSRALLSASIRNGSELNRRASSLFSSTQGQVFSPYIGSDFIGLTEWLAAILIIAGYFRPKVGIVRGLITTVMFFTTRTMILTTPGAIISVPGIHGMRYMSNLGLFLFKDVIALGVSFYLISYFGKKAIVSENKASGLAAGT